jgi:hypothetical protein
MKKFALIFVLLLSGCSMFAPDDLKNDLQFNSEVWKTSGKRVRGRMSQNLQDGRLLINKSKSDIEEMLGEPDYKTTRVWLYDVNLGGFSTI